MAEENKDQDEVKFTIQMQRGLVDQGKKLAKKQGGSFAALLRRLLIAELEREEGKK